MRIATVLLMVFGFTAGTAYAGDGCIYGSSKEMTDTTTELPTTVELPILTEGDAT